MGFREMSRLSNTPTLYRQVGTTSGRVSMSWKDVRAIVMKPGPQSLDKGILRQIGTHKKWPEGTFSRLECAKGNLGTFGAVRQQLLCPLSHCQAALTPHLSGLLESGI